MFFMEINCAVRRIALYEYAQSGLPSRLKCDVDHNVTKSEPFGMPLDFQLRRAQRVTQMNKA